MGPIAGSQKLTQPASTTGTLTYMPPKQIQARKVDARSDVFRFGVILHEMLPESEIQPTFRENYPAALFLIGWTQGGGAMTSKK